MFCHICSLLTHTPLSSLLPSSLCFMTVAHLKHPCHLYFILFKSDCLTVSMATCIIFRQEHCVQWFCVTAKTHKCPSVPLLVVLRLVSERAVVCEAALWDHISCVPSSSLLILAAITTWVTGVRHGFLTLLFFLCSLAGSLLKRRPLLCFTPWRLGGFGGKGGVEQPIVCCSSWRWLISYPRVGTLPLQSCSLNTQVLFNTRLTWCVPCSSPGIGPFSKEPQFLLVSIWK
jgi:hypothetical protein